MSGTLDNIVPFALQIVYFSFSLSSLGGQTLALRYIASLMNLNALFAAFQSFYVANRIRLLFVFPYPSCPMAVLPRAWLSFLSIRVVFPNCHFGVLSCLAIHPSCLIAILSYTHATLGRSRRLEIHDTNKKERTIVP